MMEGKKEKIHAEKINYIKLGRKGAFEKECLFGLSHNIKLGYNEISHELCKQGKWEEVRNFFIGQFNSSPGTATSHSNQIQQFYESDQNTLWITFHGDRLWWCFSTPDITQLVDHTKIRPVIGKWSDKNNKGEILTIGKLTQVQAYRGTICTVYEKDYLLAKINCEQSQQLLDVEVAKFALQEKITKVIEQLNWKDFELLIDLIFRQSGWTRMRQIGKGIKTIDLELSASVTGEKAVVQINHKANKADFGKYLKESCAYVGVDHSYFIVSQPSEDLINLKNESETKLFLGQEIADLVIAAGLIDWIITRLR